MDKFLTDNRRIKKEQELYFPNRTRNNFTNVRAKCFSIFGLVSFGVHSSKQDNRSNIGLRMALAI
jgi:hypothetical protein